MRDEQRQDPEVARWRAAHSELQSPGSSGCPDDERLVSLVLGEIEGDEQVALADHVVACRHCAASYRTLQELHREASKEPLARDTQQPVAQSTAMPLRWRLAGIAALVLLVIGLGVTGVRWWPGLTPETSSYRAAGGVSIRSLLPDEATLPRDAFVLRWALTLEGAPDGTRYSVEVTSERLDPLIEAHGLDQEEYRVPAAALEDLDPGATVFWQVAALLPDGERITGPSFVARVE